MTAGLGHNGMSRDEWLLSILHSGQVTRIAQHLALVIYHLSDPSTNIAKMSARDLEEITGWGRTAIRQHIDELEIFIRVTWGAGRAKALFELQGVITEAVKPLRARTEMARQTVITVNGNGTPDGHNGSSESGNDARGGHNGALVVVTEAATTLCGAPGGHNSGHMSDVQTATNGNGSPDGHNATRKWLATRPQGGDGGDYRGGGRKEEVFNNLHSASARVRDVDEEPPAYTLGVDGSFSGTAFEHFTATEIATMRSVFPALDLIPELINADRFFAKEFEKDGTPFESPERRARLHALLSKKNREAFAMIQAMQAVPRAVPQQLQPGVLAEGYVVTDRLRIELTNGVRSEWVQRFAVDGDEQQAAADALDDTLIELSGKIKPNSPTPIVAQIDSYLAKVARDRKDSNARYRRAAEAKGKTRSRGAVDGSVDAQKETRADRYARMLAEMDKGEKSA